MNSEPVPGEQVQTADALKTNALNADVTSRPTKMAAPALPEVTQDEVIELAQALEQRRGLQIVEDVHNLPIGGREELMPTAFQAGWCCACEEIEYWLRTEVWSGPLLSPIGARKDAAACEAVSGEQPSNGKEVLSSGDAR